MASGLNDDPPAQMHDETAYTEEPASPGLAARIGTPGTALLLGLLMTLLAGHLVRRAEQQRAEARFAGSAKTIDQAISNRMQAYLQVLRGGLGLFAASDEVNRNEWERYFEGLQLDTHFPGIQGVGFSEIFPTANSESIVQKVRADGFDEFKVWPDSDLPLRSSIVYLEPFDARNQKAFGFDMYTNETRRAAMDAAIRTGSAQMSGKVILVQEGDGKVQAGFLTYLPLYKKNAPLETANQRRAAIIGFVYSPFRMDDFMEGLLGQVDQSGIAISIYDGETDSASALMFQSDIVGDSEKSIASTLDLADHKWTLVATPSSAFAGSTGLTLSVTIYIAGVIISLLAAAIVKSLRDTEKKAIARANVMTSKLRSSEQKIRNLVVSLESRVEARTRSLVAANDELESFSYSVSHDLRAPLRSIHGFATALEEDYGEQLDAQGNTFLVKVKAAAERMGLLIDELLKLSKVSRVPMTNEPNNLSTLSESIAKALREAEPQRSVEIRIQPDLFVDTDKTLLRVVLENVISNAWKFTRDSDPALIEIGQATTDGVTEFFVRDNGAGFDSQYAEKVLMPFQRLHSDREFDGTGIGLATVQRVITRLHGTIRFESAEGVGTTFYFSLPTNDPE